MTLDLCTVEEWVIQSLDRKLIILKFRRNLLFQELLIKLKVGLNDISLNILLSIIIR